MIFAAIYYWYPKMTGRMLNEKLGKWHFWLMLIGFHVTFDFMHIPGLLGMPRQIYTYEPDRGWAMLNQIVSVGGFIQAIAIGAWCTTWCIRISMAKRRGRTHGMRGRWSGRRLRRRRPITLRLSRWCASRRPLWDMKHPEDPDSAFE